MKDDPAPSNLDRQVEQRLRRHDARYTSGRRRVVRALDTADGPRAAADIHAQIGDDVPLSSLYRSLAVLEEAGVVARHYSADATTRFELAEWLSGHHHHLRCLSCGTVDDITTSGELERQLQTVVERIAAAAGFEAADHVLDIEGQCANCA